MRAKQSVSAPRRGNVGYFDRLLRTSGTDLRLSKTPKGTILASQGAGIRGMSGKMTRQLFSAGT
jgi:hypothetical protein